MLRRAAGGLFSIVLLVPLRLLASRVICSSLSREQAATLFWSRNTDQASLEGVLTELGVQAEVATVAALVGTAWGFECMRLHCPVQMLDCVLSSQCRTFLRESKRPAHGAPEACIGGPADWCGQSCSDAVLEHWRCLHASPCAEPFNTAAAIVMPSALTDDDLERVMSLERHQCLTVKPPERRNFGGGVVMYAWTCVYTCVQACVLACA